MSELVDRILAATPEAALEAAADEGDPRRDRRPAERREVVAPEPAPRLRARDRRRHRRHDPRRARHAARGRRHALRARRHRRYPPPQQGARSPRALLGRERDRGARPCRRRRARDRRRRGPHRPRTRGSRRSPGARARASCSSSTNGTSGATSVRRPISRTSRTRCRRSSGFPMLTISAKTGAGVDAHPAGGETRRGGARRRAPDRAPEPGGGGGRPGQGATVGAGPPTTHLLRHPGRAPPPDGRRIFAVSPEASIRATIATFRIRSRARSV